MRILLLFSFLIIRKKEETKYNKRSNIKQNQSNKGKLKYYLPPFGGGG
jgi:hypothetical protein